MSTAGGERVPEVVYTARVRVKIQLHCAVTTPETASFLILSQDMQTQ
jgi:hypothetical protein